MNPAWTSLLSDISVEDIVCKAQGAFFFKQGHWEGPIEAFSNVAELEAFARRIAERAASSLGLANPTVDAQLFHEESQSLFRAHVVSPPMSPLGMEITLRRLPGLFSYSLEDFIFSNPEQRAQLELAVERGDSLLVAGATGSGKTSLVTALLRRLAPQTRVVLLEDCAELPLPNHLSTRLITRKDVFGFREGATWDLEHLVYESLRMRPERLVLGECRGREAAAVLRALATGHRGLMTTLHAGSCTEAIERFFALAGEPCTPGVWDWVVHLDTDGQGKRHVRQILAPT